MTAKRKDRRFTVCLDDESAELLERITEELAEGNRSQGARRAIQTAARVLLDQPAYTTTRRPTYAAPAN